MQGCGSPIGLGRCMVEGTQPTLIFTFSRSSSSTPLTPSPSSLLLGSTRATLLLGHNRYLYFEIRLGTTQIFQARSKSRYQTTHGWLGVSPKKKLRRGNLIRNDGAHCTTSVPKKNVSRDGVRKLPSFYQPSVQIVTGLRQCSVLTEKKNQ